MEPTQERITALEQAVNELHGRQIRVEQQLRRWRGLAGLLVVGSLLFQPVRAGKAAPGTELGLAARMAALERVFYYQLPRVRRVAPAAPGLSARVTALERAVNYEESQITVLGTAVNQEIAARQATDARLPQPVQEAGRAQPQPPTTSSPFTDAQTTTLRKLAGLLVVSGGMIRCNGDLALTLGHILLTNKVAPIDADARADDHGTIELSGNVSVAKKLSSSATAKAEPK